MFNEEELILIRSCLLFTKDFLNRLSYKNKDIKEKLKKIDNLLKKSNTF